MQCTNRHGVVTISYTSLGAQLQGKLGGVFQAIEPDAEVYAYGYRKAKEHTDDAETIDTFEKTEDILERHFDMAEVILFISAAGIAVRKIAPYLKSKTTDPAVLCMDEMGRFVIPLVSGHLGGANAWAQKIAEQIGATAVITTATDGRGIFAVDLFAKKNGLLIADSSRIKEVSARLLAGEKVGICTNYAIGGNVPEGLVYCKKHDRPKCGITITENAMLPQQFDIECRMIPKNLVLGIGCRKKTSADALEEFIRKVMKKNGLDIRRVCAVASIDIKKEEEGILEAARHLGVPFQVYDAETLRSCEGKFTASAFVEAQVGVDNVCERSSMYAAGAGAELLVRKTAADGMTVSVAAQEVHLDW